METLLNQDILTFKVSMDRCSKKNFWKKTVEFLETQNSNKKNYAEYISFQTLF